MKIVFCIHGLSNSGGMERVITTKASYFSDFFGYNVQIITLNNSTNSFFDVSEKVKILAFDLSEKARLIDYVNSFKPDFFISTGGKEVAFLGRLSKKIIKISEIHFCFHFPILREVSRGSGLLCQFIGVLKLIRYIFLLRKADKVVSLTERDRLYWSKYLGFDKCIEIPNYIFQGDQKQKFSSFKNRGNLVAIGRLNDQKGFQDLIDTMILIKNTNWVLDIYGEGELSASLNKKIIQNGLVDKISIRPPTNNITEVYKKSSALLMSSYYEGMPMVMLEALSNGVPCISFDCDSGPSELIRDFENGFLIKGRNKAEFAASVTRLLNLERSEYMEMSINSLRSVKKYDIEIVMDRWKRLFEECQ